MAYGKFISFLVQGFLIGAGPCMLICAPIVIPFIAGTKSSWREGLRAVLVFGFTRMAVYALMGGAVGYVGYHMFRLFFSHAWGDYVWGAAGVLIILMGIAVIAGKGVKNPFCRAARGQGMVYLGIVMGISPCLPLIAVLTEIMFLSRNFFQGFLYGAAFGVGTVFSPLLLLGALAPAVPAGLFRSEKAQRAFNLLCGAVLVGMGLFIIWRR